MVSQIKLVISENDKIIQTYVKKADTQPSSLVKSLEEFQKAANDILTKLIEENKYDNKDDDCESEDNDDDIEDNTVDAKRRKK